MIKVTMMNSIRLHMFQMNLWKRKNDNCSVYVWNPKWLPSNNKSNAKMSYGRTIVLVDQVGILDFGNSFNTFI